MAQMSDLSERAAELWRTLATEAGCGDWGEAQYDEGLASCSTDDGSDVAEMIDAAADGDVAALLWARGQWGLRPIV